jgi:hypothetical protein
LLLLSICRLQQYARDARKEYAELGSKDLSELKSFVKGLPKLLLLDRLSDLAVPVAEVVKEQVRLRSQQAVESRTCMHGGLWSHVRCGCGWFVSAAAEHVHAGRLQPPRSMACAGVSAMQF